MKVKITSEYELQLNEFVCSGCKKIVKRSDYAIAQKAMGNALIYTCKCGAKTSV